VCPGRELTLARRRPPQAPCSLAQPAPQCGLPPLRRDAASLDIFQRRNGPNVNHHTGGNDAGKIAVSLASLCAKGRSFRARPTWHSSSSSTPGVSRSWRMRRRVFLDFFSNNRAFRAAGIETIKARPPAAVSRAGHRPFRDGVRVCPGSQLSTLNLPRMLDRGRAGQTMVPNGARDPPPRRGGGASRRNIGEKWWADYRPQACAGPRVRHGRMRLRGRPITQGRMESPPNEGTPVIAPLIEEPAAGAIEECRSHPCDEPGHDGRLALGITTHHHAAHRHRRAIPAFIRAIDLAAKAHRTPLCRAQQKKQKGRGPSSAATCEDPAGKYRPPQSGALLFPHPPNGPPTTACFSGRTQAGESTDCAGVKGLWGKKKQARKRSNNQRGR